MDGYHDRVVAVDLRGYGESDAPGAVNEYTLDKLVEDIRQLIPSLGKSNNWDSCQLTLT